MYNYYKEYKYGFLGDLSISYHCGSGASFLALCCCGVVFRLNALSQSTAFYTYPFCKVCLLLPIQTLLNALLPFTVHYIIMSIFATCLCYYKIMFHRITALHNFNERTLTRITNGFCFMPFRKLKLKTLTLHRSFLKTFFWGQLVYYVHTLLHCRNFKWKPFVFIIWNDLTLELM